MKNDNVVFKNLIEDEPRSVSLTPLECKIINKVLINKENRANVALDLGISSSDVRETLDKWNGVTTGTDEIMLTSLERNIINQTLIEGKTRVSVALALGISPKEIKTAIDKWNGIPNK